METTNNTNPTLAEIEKELAGYTEQPVINKQNVTEPKTGKRGRPKKGMEQEQQPDQIAENPVISGSLLVLMIDLLLPNLIAFANNKFTSKKIKASKLQMSAKQREELIPIADQVAKEMSLKANPMTVLIISLLGIYGINYMQLKNE